MTVERTKLGDVLTLDREPITVDPRRRYVSIGVRGFGRGLFRYPEMSGSELGRLRFFNVGHERLIVSNIKGWEGAVARSSRDDVGLVASNRFLQFACSPSLDLSYLHHYLLSDVGLQQLGRASPGSTDRNRTLSIKGFEDIEVPLPRIDSQRRIAERLDGVCRTSARLNGRLPLDAAGVVAILPSVIQNLIDGMAVSRCLLSDMVDMVSDIVHPGDGLGDAAEFVGLEHIESHTGRRIGGRPIGIETGRKQRFQPGDIVFGYLRPYLNKVWLADRHGLCSVEQYALRPRLGVDPPLLSAALRTRGTLDEVIALTNSLQLPRLGSGQLLALELLDCRQPPEGLASRIAAVETLVAGLAAAQRHRDSVLAALLPAARNEVFSQLR